jgi:hypothetical protein
MAGKKDGNSVGLHADEFSDSGNEKVETAE